MADLSVLAPGILAAAPDAPDPTIERSLREAAREFCRVTQYWVEELSPVDLVADQGAYTLTLPSGSMLTDLNEVRADGRPLGATTRKKLTAGDSRWPDRAGTPREYYREGAAGLRLVPKPATASTAGLTVHAVLGPGFDAAELPDLLVNDHGEALVHGALARLLAIPGKSWSDGGLAAYHSTMFLEAMREASSRAADGYVTGTPRKVRYGGY